MGRALGVSDSKADIDSGTVTGLSSLGVATGGSVGFYGTTPITQRSSSLQATSLVSATSASFAAAYKDALVEIMNALQAVGIWKGSA